MRPPKVPILGTRFDSHESPEGPTSRPTPPKTIIPDVMASLSRPNPFGEVRKNQAFPPKLT
jgi:hypothetical protein